MSTIAESIWRIVKPRLDGELLKAAKNGLAITAGVGSSKDLTTTQWSEVSRISVVKRITSDSDPDTYIDVSQPTQVTFADDVGKYVALNMSPP